MIFLTVFSGRTINTSESLIETHGLFVCYILPFFLLISITISFFLKQLAVSTYKKILILSCLVLIVVLGLVLLLDFFVS